MVPVPVEGTLPVPVPPVAGGVVVVGVVVGAAVVVVVGVVVVAEHEALVPPLAAGSLALVATGALPHVPDCRFVGSVVVTVRPGGGATVLAFVRGACVLPAAVDLPLVALLRFDLVWLFEPDPAVGFLGAGLWLVAGCGLSGGCVNTCGAVTSVRAGATAATA